MYSTEKKLQQIIKHYLQLIHFIPNKRDRQTLLLCMYQLTPSGFEHYIAGYFKEILGYNIVQVNGGIKDRGLDIVCKKNDEYAVVQCKKYETNHVHGKDILYFNRCANHIIEKQKPMTKKFFITTNRCNPQSLVIAQECNIELWDWKYIINTITTSYPIEHFLHIHKNNKQLVHEYNVIKLVSAHIMKSSYYKKLKHHISEQKSKVLSSISQSPVSGKVLAYTI